MWLYIYGQLNQGIGTMIRIWIHCQPNPDKYDIADQYRVSKQDRLSPLYNQIL